MSVQEEKKADDIPPTNIQISKPDPKSLKKLKDNLKTLYNYKAKYTINNDGSCTFYPTPNCEPLKDTIYSSTISMGSVIQSNDCSKIEAYSNPNKKVIDASGTMCSFITSSLEAWSKHYPFRFKCEHIWLLILQAVAVHVDQNSEKLRNKYVKHDGKKQLNVIRDEFVLGSPDNDWKGVVEEFVEQIDKNTVEDTVQLFECDFTSSTLTERIAAKITVMDICKNYFEYCMWTTCCGFSQVTLDGTKTDWIKLRNKCIQLLNEKVDKKYGKTWEEALIPLLDRFIVAFDGEIDGLFWNSMIKRGATHGSGASSWITGWFNILFPFTAKGSLNQFCVPYSINHGYVQQGLKLSTRYSSGHDTDMYGSGLSSAPVLWTYLGKKINLKFISGFVGYTQDPKTFEIVPNVDWCIAHKMTDEEIEKKKKKDKKSSNW